MQNAQQQIDDLLRFLRQAATALQTQITTGLAGLATIYSQETTLGAPSTNITAVVAPEAGSELKVVIIVDGTAGRQITWSSDFVGASVDFDNSINTTSYFTFLGRAVAGVTKWHLSALPLTGQA